MAINSREEACQILGVSTSASESEINKAYKKLALKWHPDKWANKSEEEKKAAEKKFKEINEAKEYLDRNHGSNSDSHKLDKWKNEARQKIAKWISDEKVSDEELGEWKDWEDKINKMESTEELINYLQRFVDWSERYLKNNSANNNDSSSHSEKGGSDSGYSSDSSDYSSSTKSEPYYEPFTCDYCGYTVPSWDSRPKITEGGKQFCKHLCADLYIQREYKKEEHEKRMNQIREDSRKSNEEHQERMKKLDQEAEERRKKNNEKWEQWKKENDEYWRKADQESLENSKSFCINQVEFYIHLYEVSEQQANEWLGNNWREQFNNFGNWREMHRQMDKYIKILESKKWIIELAKDKERAIEYIEWFLDLHKVEDQQLSQELSCRDWKEEINRCSNQGEVKRKERSLKRKVEKIKDNIRGNSNEVDGNLTYSQKNYVEKQLALPRGQSLQSYLNSAKTPEERKQRENEIRQILNRWEQDNKKTRATIAITGLLIVGAIVGLIIFLVRRNKKRDY